MNVVCLTQVEKVCRIIGSTDPPRPSYSPKVKTKVNTRRILQPWNALEALGERASGAHGLAAMGRPTVAGPDPSARCRAVKALLPSLPDQSAVLRSVMGVKYLAMASGRSSDSEMNMAPESPASESARATLPRSSLSTS